MQYVQGAAFRSDPATLVATMPKQTADAEPPPFEEQLMKSKAPMIACGIGILVMGVMLVGAEPAAREPVRWEYAMYVESPGNFEWHGAVAHIRATNATFFFERMGFPTGSEVSAQTGRIQPVLLNHLGQQGWELVEVAPDPARTVYWFKRPR